MLYRANAGERGLWRGLFLRAKGGISRAPYRNGERDGISARFQKNLGKPLDKRSCLWYNINVRRGVAQFGRVLGSGPRGRWFKSSHSDRQKDVRMDVLFLLFQRTCAGRG